MPAKYDNTIIRLLAQSPKTLFVYWEISSKDAKKYENMYGNEFWKITVPILIVHNLTYNKHYEVEINDFANCWYLNTEDSNCEFNIELARKFIKLPTAPSNETNVVQPTVGENLYIARSNYMQSPNDHILVEKLGDYVLFSNVSTGETFKKSSKSYGFLKDLYSFYSNMYDDEDILKNPSSQF